MKNSTLNNLAEKLTKAFVSNKLINPLHHIVLKN